MDTILWSVGTKQKTHIFWILALYPARWLPVTGRCAWERELLFKGHTVLAIQDEEVLNIVNNKVMHVSI